MLPALAEVVLVLDRVAGLLKDLDDRNLPAGFARLATQLLGWNADPDLVLVVPDGLEQVQVPILPAHRVLNRDVDVPEGVARWDDDPTPDRRGDALELNAELQDRDSGTRRPSFRSRCGTMAHAMLRHLRVLVEAVAL